MPPLPPGFDATSKFVQVTRWRADGFVEFNFAMGEPGLFVELILPAGAFDEFCAANQVRHLDPPSSTSPSDPCKDDADWEWRLSHATRQRFKSPPG